MCPGTGPLHRALGRSNGKRKGKFKRAKRLLPQRGRRAPSSLESTDRELAVRWQSPIGAKIVVRDRPIELVSVCDKDLKGPSSVLHGNFASLVEDADAWRSPPCLGWRPDALAARKLSARRCEWARGLLARLVRPPCLSKRSREDHESHVRSCANFYS